MAQARMERELMHQAPSSNPITGLPGLPPKAPVRSQQVRGGASIIQDQAFMDGASDMQMRGNKRAIKDSKMQQIAKFDSQFQKPMADRSPQILDALYFRNQRNDGGAIQRTNSVNLANTGHRVMGSYDQSPVHGEPRVGKRMTHVPVGSTSNLLYGNYGTDPESNLERNFKPYSKSVNRS
jgi:hypothetical protein